MLYVFQYNCLLKQKPNPPKTPNTHPRLKILFICLSEITLDALTKQILHENPKDLQWHKEKNSFDRALAR